MKQKNLQTHCMKITLYHPCQMYVYLKYLTIQISQKLLSCRAIQKSLVVGIHCIQIIISHLSSLGVLLFMFPIFNSSCSHLPLMTSIRLDYRMITLHFQTWWMCEICYQCLLRKYNKKNYCRHYTNYIFCLTLDWARFLLIYTNLRGILPRKMQICAINYTHLQDIHE